MNGICAVFIQYCTTIYPTGLCDEQKQPHPQGVSCSINRVLPTSKSVINLSLNTSINNKYLENCWFFHVWEVF